MPELEPLLEFDDIRVWFAVPGMYGGFSYRLEAAGVKAIGVGELVPGGQESGERHEITSASSHSLRKALYKRHIPGFLR